MMTTSGAVKVVSDLSEMADLAKVLADPGKLQSLRDEFSAVLQELKDQEQLVDDKTKQLQDSQTVYSLNYNAAKKWEQDLKDKEDTLISLSDTLSHKEKSLSDAEIELSQSQKALSQDQKAFTNTKAVMLKSIDDIQKQSDKDILAKNTVLQKREDAVRAREETLKALESNLFKKTQLIASLKDSLG